MVYQRDSCKTHQDIYLCSEDKFGYEKLAALYKAHCLSRTSFGQKQKYHVYETWVYHILSYLRSSRNTAIDMMCLARRDTAVALESQLRFAPAGKTYHDQKKKLLSLFVFQFCYPSRNTQFQFPSHGTPTSLITQGKQR
jgi:hypothetical protein